MTRILAVDDSESMRKMVAFTLERSGYEVAEAGDGVEALELAQQERFDLIITDINMPEMDGITLIRRLRALPDYRFRPILTLTTEGSLEKKREGREAGATGWIVKPFDPDVLIQTIRKVL